jgi:hypothetical protein
LTLFCLFAGNMADVLTIAPRLAAPGIYNSLGHIDIVGTRHIYQAVSLTQTLLAKAGLEPVVGVSRLHKHFDLASDEVVVAELSIDRTEIKSSVCKTSDLGSHHIPMSWAFRHGSWQCYQVLLLPATEERALSEEFRRRAAECEAKLHALIIGAVDTDVAAAWSEFTAGAADGDVGVSLRFVDLLDGMDLKSSTLVETTDEETRVQVIRPVARLLSEGFAAEGHAADRHTVETHWFRKDGVIITVNCSSGCGGQGGGG